jgi:hypothetical protein
MVGCGADMLWCGGGRRLKNRMKKEIFAAPLIDACLPFVFGVSLPLNAFLARKYLNSDLQIYK